MAKIVDHKYSMQYRFVDIHDDTSFGSIRPVLSSYKMGK